MSHRGKPTRKRGWLAQLLFDRFFIKLVLVAFLFFIALPSIQAFADEHGEHVTLAFETTAWHYFNDEFGPRNTMISMQLHDMAEAVNLADYDQKAIISAASIETPRPKGMSYFNWLVRRNAFAADLLGLSEIESSYCNNIGGGIAYYEVLKRIDRLVEEGADPRQLVYWTAQLAALEIIAFQLHVDVLSIPGSIGAGAISCFQLMPTSWLHYGGGDYRDSYDAARNAARYLKAHGYFTDREVAILSYNFNAGQPYVDSVLNAALKWQDPVWTALVLMPVPWNLLTLFMEFSEILAWYMNEYGITVGLVNIGDIVNPAPGSILCENGNGFGEVISDTYTHWGVDLCGSLKAYAMHDGRVVFSGFISIHDAAAWNESSPDYVSASGYVVVLEGVTADGRTIQTIYAHLDPDSIPPDGVTLKAGDYISTAKCTGNLDEEYCYGDHLHLGLKIDGDIKHNPLDFFD